VGSGPAGMAAAQQLARVGHDVTLYEKEDRIGGLLRYGIPDFKMEKHLIDRRVKQMAAEGVTFRAGVHVGMDMPVDQLLAEHDAVLLTGGAEHPRDLPVPGRELKGIHYAMDFLRQNNKRVAGDKIPKAEAITAKGKHVIVIGGGDTGSDCIGTSTRMGAASVTQLEILDRPPDQENKPLVWPYWPLKYRTSSSQEEGAEREFAVATKTFLGDAAGNVTTLRAVRLQGGKELKGSEFDLEADLVLLAMGFVHPVHAGMLKNLGIKLDPRGNVLADTVKYQSSNPKVFAAGDMRRGQSLVVWAIREGRQAARAVDEWLMGTTDLPR
jgi:glutamate synthase (NADPH) small chain